MTCFVDDGESPECVLDPDNTKGFTAEDCTVAVKLIAEGKGKIDCPYWKSPDPYIQRIER